MSLTTILKSSVFGAAFVLASAVGLNAQNSTLIYNKGAMFFINGGPNDSALVYVDGHVVNQDSIMINKGKFIIKGDFINNAQSGGFNTPPLLLPGNNGLFEVYGKWVNNGVFNAGSGQVRFMADDTITGTSVTRFNRLTLDSAVVRVMTLDAEISPTGRLELNRGELATDYSTMWVLNPNTTAITRHNPCIFCGFVSSLGDGTLARATNQAQDYLFPVGSSYIADPGTSEIRYRPVVLTPQTNADDMYHVRFANVNPAPFGMPLEQTDTTICYVNPKWYHRIHQEGGANATAGVGIAYTLSPGTDFDANAIAKWNPNTNRWENLLNNVDGSFGPYSQVSRPAWNGFLSGNGDFENNYALAFTYPHFPPVEGDSAICARVQHTYTVPSNGSNYEFTLVPEESGNIIAQDQYSVTVEWNDVGQGTLQVTETVPNTINGGCEGIPRLYTVDIWPLPTADFTITPDPSLTPNGGGIFINDIIEMADNSQLTEEWDWDFGDGSTSTQSNPYHSYDAVGDYDVTLIVTTDLGCTDTLIQSLKVVEGIIVPNVFTPNNDGFNDVFNVRTSDVGPFNILIYNRWGNIVFETTAPEISWDGTTRAGVPAPAGTYYFTITKVGMNSGNVIDNEQDNFNFRETGWLQLIR